MAEHETKAVDTQVRGYPGTIATCACGWRSAWAVRDGSAEAAAHVHMMSKDVAYQERDEERTREWRDNLVKHGCQCKIMRFSYVMSLECPLHNPPRSTPTSSSAEHLHNCSCHLSAPCGACENCAHADNPECENDCQECEEHDG